MISALFLLREIDVHHRHALTSLDRQSYSGMSNDYKTGLFIDDYILDPSNFRQHSN